MHFINMALYNVHSDFYWNVYILLNLLSPLRHSLMFQSSNFGICPPFLSTELIN